MNIKIINARPSNAIDLLNINSLTWLNTYESKKYGINKEIVNKYPISEDKKRLFIERKSKEIKDNPGSYILVKDDEKIVGYACGKIYPDKNYNEFFAIYILPEYHKKGIGKLLADEVFNYLGKEKKIIVKVIGYNYNAIGFYKSLGFKKDIDLKNFEILDGIGVPEIQMIKNGTTYDNN